MANDRNSMQKWTAEDDKHLRDHAPLDHFGRNDAQWDRLSAKLGRSPAALIARLRVIDEREAAFRAGRKLNYDAEQLKALSLAWRRADEAARLEFIRRHVTPKVSARAERPVTLDMEPVLPELKEEPEVEKEPPKE